MSNFARKAMFLLAFSVVLCGVWILQADAKTYFVSKAGADQNPGTKDLPKFTIQAAMADANEGDTVIIGSGTFGGPITLGKGLSIIGSADGKSIIRMSRVEDGRVFNLSPGDTLVGSFLIKDLVLKYPEKNQFSANGHISDVW